MIKYKIQIAVIIMSLSFSVSGRNRSSNNPFEKSIETLVNTLASTLPQQANVRIGVIPFTGSEKESVDEASLEGRAVAEKIVTLLFNHPAGFVVVDRIDYEKALQEIALSQTGLTSESMEVEIGMFMSADYLVSGSISPVMGQSAIRARAVNVSTGEVAAAAETAISSSLLQQSASDLFSEQQSVISYAFRSAVMPGWGQFYAQKPVRGTISLLLGTGAAGFTVYSWVSSANRKNERDSFSQLANTNSGREELVSRSGFAIGTDDFNQWYKAEIDSYQDSYSTMLTTAKIATVSVAGIWILNMVDASIAGTQRSRAVRLYFSAAWDDYATGLAFHF